MSRRRLKELHDYYWYPALMREYMTDFLAFFALHFFQYNPVFPVIAKVLRDTGITKIRDLCSGAASCVPRLEKYLNEKNSCNVRIELTDLYPNIKAFQRVADAAGPMVSYCEQPVDAMNTTSEGREFRMMFSAVHHFNEEELENIISNAMDNNCAIGFFDYATRNLLLTLLLMPGLIPLIWCVTPFLRPFSWTRLLLTYILPVVPVLIFIDGFISRWNAYAAKDFEHFRGLVESRGWKCESATLPNFFYTGEVLYFICCPPDADKKQ